MCPPPNRNKNKSKINTIAITLVHVILRHLVGQLSHQLMVEILISLHLNPLECLYTFSPLLTSVWRPNSMGLFYFFCLLLLCSVIIYIEVKSPGSFLLTLLIKIPLVPFISDKFHIFFRLRVSIPFYINAYSNDKL